MLDGVVARDELCELLVKTLSLGVPRPMATRPLHVADNTETVGLVDKTALEVLALARHTGRPTARAYIDRIFADFVELHGDKLTGDDGTVIGGLARIEDSPVIVIAQEARRGETADHGTSPAGYHKAERLIHLAERWKLPIITFVDTTGADPGDESERHGIASAVAHCLAALLETPVPTVAAILGEGPSGGALSLAAADRVLMQQYAVYMVISPEGASAIRYGDTSHATELAESLGITVRDFLPRGIVDRAVAEPDGGAHTDVDGAARLLKAALLQTLAELLAMNETDRLAARRARYRGD